MLTAVLWVWVVMGGEGRGESIGGGKDWGGEEYWGEVLEGEVYWRGESIGGGRYWRSLGGVGVLG